MKRRESLLRLARPACVGWVAEGSGCTSAVHRLTTKGDRSDSRRRRSTAECLGRTPESLDISIVAEEGPRHLGVELRRASDAEQAIVIGKVVGKVAEVHLCTV